MLYLALLAQLASIVLLVWIAWRDIRTFTISNQLVLAFLLLYLPAQGFLGFPTLWQDLMAGGLLFVIGFMMWMLGVLGAGDSKLMLPLGLHLGYMGLAPFVVFLMVFSILFYLIITVSAFAGAERGAFGWLAELKRSGRVPYGLPLAVAAVPVMALRMGWFIFS
ncbi:prepilin peptidase [Maribius pontilimi]|uniref:Prepilin peptidase n=1 Tax=Palleronia pontilimi TaxID=1964209 RepID=A0A934IIQ9_9RHOB|nr:prepilin peptidase [Palleronia pontilimi]MBJ3763661.1 prepilin peptidase [Palleronia pontilimi]